MIQIMKVYQTNQRRLKAKVPLSGISFWSRYGLYFRLGLLNKVEKAPLYQNLGDQQTKSLHAQILTNTKSSQMGSLSTSTIANNTAVAPFIGLFHTRDDQCTTITPLCWTWLPLLTPIFLLSWVPLPVVAQRFCPSGLDSKLCRFSWDSVLQFLWMSGDSGRVSYIQKTGCELYTHFQ